MEMYVGFLRVGTHCQRASWWYLVRRGTRKNLWLVRGKNQILNCLWSFINLKGWPRTFDPMKNVIEDVDYLVCLHDIIFFSRMFKEPECTLHISFYQEKTDQVVL